MFRPNLQTRYEVCHMTTRILQMILYMPSGTVTLPAHSLIFIHICSYTHCHVKNKLLKSMVTKLSQRSKMLGPCASSRAMVKINKLKEKPCIFQDTSTCNFSRKSLIAFLPTEAILLLSTVISRSFSFTVSVTVTKSPPASRITRMITYLACA